MKKKLTVIQHREMRNLIEEQNDINLAKWFIDNDLNPHDYIDCLIRESEDFAEPYASVAIQLSVWRNEMDKKEY